MSNYLPFYKRATLLPPQRKLWGGNVFTGTCHFVHGAGEGCTPSDCPPPGHTSLGLYPPEPQKWAVHTLLECFLVHTKFHKSFDFGGINNCVLHQDKFVIMNRGLCVDALIVMSDRDADWELDLDEFRNCLDPDVEPPKKRK